MKKLFLLIPALFILACVGKKETFDSLRNFPKPKFTPPGTIWLKDNIFIDDMEVTNVGYVEFLYWLQKNDKSKYYLMVPDTNCWTRSDIGRADKLITHYLNSYAYRNYPVVGITYSQAVEFCKWRTDMVNELLYVKANNLKHSADSEKVYMARAPKKVKYRLPNQREWEYAAAAGLDFCTFPMGYESLTTYNVPVNNTLEYHNFFLKDFRAVDKPCGKAIEVNCPTVKVDAGKYNRYGLYQMMGNVSEICADSVVKGFNYSLPIFSIERSESAKGSFTISSTTYSYDISKKFFKPEPWLGFRCVCEVY